jgi:hypothetical protein
MLLVLVAGNVETAEHKAHNDTYSTVFQNNDNVLHGPEFSYILFYSDEFGVCY